MHFKKKKEKEKPVQLNRAVQHNKAARGLCIALIGIFCGLDVCTAAGFPNSPLSFCFTLQDLPARLF